MLYYSHKHIFRGIVMSRNFFIGDLHLRHANILRFSDLGNTPEEHDKIIVDNVCSAIRKRDVIWLTGDICFKEDGVKDLAIIAKNASIIKWVLGNHDDHRAVRLAIETIPNLLVYGLNSYKGTWVSHMPIHDSEFRNRKKNIHGHLHTNIIKDERYFNSSADNINYTPVSFDDIMSGYMGVLWDEKD